ncbi:hypothetical protein V8V50_10830 [Ligilactobacillus salivarius]
MSKFINTQCCCLVTCCPVGNMEFDMQKLDSHFQDWINLYIFIIGTDTN